MAKAKPAQNLIANEDTALAVALSKGIPQPPKPKSGMMTMLEGLPLTDNVNPLNNASTDLIRTQLLKFLLDGPRDIDSECGYPLWLTPAHYQAMYDREGIAARVVNCEPEESWAVDPEVYEDEDETTETEFEKQWADLVKTKNIYHYLLRIDQMSGIGQYGILFLNIDDGKDPLDSVDGINDDGTWEKGNEYKLLQIRPFDESVVFVKTREVDVNNPRYGLPTRYTIQFRDFPNWGIQMGEVVARDVHWSRVIHVADNLKNSTIYGIPRMQQVWNRLYDLRKIYSSSGEAFWKGAFPGLAFEVNPEIADQGIALDKDAIRDEMARFQNGLQRYIAITGMTTKTIPPMVVDPTGSVETHLKAIAISKGIPYRILFGSEEAKLAGAQDDRRWNGRLKKRQEKYISPMILRPFIDRMMAYGVLDQIDEYFIEWEDLNSPTDIDKAQVGLVRSQAMAQYVQSQSSQLMPPMLYLTLVLGLTTEEAQECMDQSQEMEDQNNGEETGEEDEQLGEGSLGGPATPDQGDIFDQSNLDGSTTIPKGGKRVDSTFVSMPELNKADGNGKAEKVKVKRKRR